jgi:hypothetical protein
MQKIYWNEMIGMNEKTIHNMEKKNITNKKKIITNTPILNKMQVYECITS